MEFRFSRLALYALTFAVMVLIFGAVSACSSSPTTPAAPASTSAPAATSRPLNTTPSAPTSPDTDFRQRQGMLGTVISINGDILTMTTLQGQTVEVGITSSTMIDKTVTAALTDLQQGEFLTIAGSPDAGGVIAATSIQSRRQLQDLDFPTPAADATFPSPVPGATFPAGRQNRQGAGNGDDNGGMFARTIGTLDSVSGITLTVTILQGSQVEVNVSPQTVIERTVAGITADLQEGESITVMGPTADNGDITAESISIRPPGQSFPAPPLTPN